MLNVCSIKPVSKSVKESRFCSENMSEKKQKLISRHLLFLCEGGCWQRRGSEGFFCQSQCCGRASVVQEHIYNTAECVSTIIFHFTVLFVLLPSCAFVFFLFLFFTLCFISATLFLVIVTLISIIRLHIPQIFFVQHSVTFIYKLWLYFLQYWLYFLFWTLFVVIKTISHNCDTMWLSHNVDFFFFHLTITFCIFYSRPIQAFTWLFCAK